MTDQTTPTTYDYASSVGFSFRSTIDPETDFNDLTTDQQRERLRAAEKAPDPRNLFAGVVNQSAIDQLSDDDVDRLYEILRKVK